jgi:class 3 adenylate cyclase
MQSRHPPRGLETWHDDVVQPGSRSGAPPVSYARTHDGGHVGYQTWGDGSFATLNLKEWGASLDAIWEHPVHLRLQQYWGSFSRCLNFDPRGTGVSDPVPPERVGNLDCWVEDAIAALDAARFDRVVVFAEGFAGHAGITLSIAEPERIEALVLANSYPSLAASESRPYGQAPEAIDAVAALVERAWGSGQIVHRDVPAIGSDDAFLDFCARFERAAASPATAARWVRAAYSSDVTALLPQVTARTLVFHTGDLAHVPAAAARDLAQRIPRARLLEMPSPSFYWFDDPEKSREFTEFVFGSTVDDRGTRELLTIVFIDIADSTARAAKLGDHRWENILDGVDAFVRRTVDRFGGRAIKQTGDGHMAAFAIPSDALRAALAIAGGVHALGVEVRTGINVGEVQVRMDGDLSGLAVNVAARTMTAAAPGEVLVTAGVPALVVGSGFAFADRGTHQLKGVPGDWELLALFG